MKYVLLLSLICVASPIKSMGKQDRNTVEDPVKVADELMTQAIARSAEGLLRAFRSYQETEGKGTNILKPHKESSTAAAELVELLLDGKTPGKGSKLTDIIRRRLLFMIASPKTLQHATGEPVDVSRKEAQIIAADKARATAIAMKLAAEPDHASKREGIFSQTGRLSVTNNEVAELLYSESSPLSLPARELYFAMLAIATNSPK